MYYLKSGRLCQGIFIIPQLNLVYKVEFFDTEQAQVNSKGGTDRGTPEFRRANRESSQSLSITLERSMLNTARMIDTEV